MKQGLTVERARAIISAKRSLNRAPLLERMTPRLFERIVDIYEDAKRRTRETGTNWRVDHTRPVSKGGSSHPDNLTVMTEAEDKAKGNTWNGPVSEPTRITVDRRKRNQGR